MIDYLRALAARLRGLFGDRGAGREFSDEIQVHLELLTERYVRQGMTEVEARCLARRQFGNVTLLKEANREMRRIRLIDTLVQDLRFGARMLLKHKGLTALATLSLAMGIGANTAIFSLADAFLWRALPAVNNDSLFALVRSDPLTWTWSYPDYLVFRDNNKSFAGLAALDIATLAFGDGERSRVVIGELVTGNYFDVLGTPMSQGRAFSPEEDRTPGAHPVVVVSHDFWVRGPGRSSGRRAQDDHQTGPAADAHRHGDWVAGGAGDDARGGEYSLWRDLDRSADLRRSGHLFDERGAARLLCARAQGGQNRSDDGVAV
jgi:MacB-like periplasmic core domain